MLWYEVLIIIGIISFVVITFAVYGYKKLIRKSNDCCECHNPKRMKKKMNKIRKELNEECTCPHCNSK